MRTTAETTGVACRGSQTYTRTTPFAAPDAAPASAHVTPISHVLLTPGKARRTSFCPGPSVSYASRGSVTNRSEALRSGVAPTFTALTTTLKLGPRPRTDASRRTLTPPPPPPRGAPRPPPPRSTRRARARGVEAQTAQVLLERDVHVAAELAFARGLLHVQLGFLRDGERDGGGGGGVYPSRAGRRRLLARRGMMRVGDAPVRELDAVLHVGRARLAAPKTG